RALARPPRPGVLVARGDVGPEAEPVAPVVEAVLEGRSALAVRPGVDEVRGVVAHPADHAGLPVERHGERGRGGRLRPRRCRRSEDHGAGREKQSDSLHPSPPMGQPVGWPRPGQELHRSGWKMSAAPRSTRTATLPPPTPPLRPGPVTGPPRSRPRSSVVSSYPPGSGRASPRPRGGTPA